MLYFRYSNNDVDVQNIQVTWNAINFCLSSSIHKFPVQHISISLPHEMAARAQYSARNIKINCVIWNKILSLSSQSCADKWLLNSTVVCNKNFQVNIILEFDFLISDMFAFGLDKVSVTLPPAIASGGSAILMCQYDLGDDSLYTVKWYKGTREFYRYTAKEIPPIKSFPPFGFYLDVSTSSKLYRNNLLGLMVFVCCTTCLA